MRGLLLVLAACGGAAPVAATTAAAGDGTHPPSQRGATAIDDPLPADPIAALAPAPDQKVASLVPGRARLELAGATIDAPGGNRPIEVVLLERHGSEVRIGVRLEHARFGVWTDASRLLGVIARDHKLTPIGPPTAMHATLRAGARVRRLARKDRRTHVRYVGAVELEGWIPDDNLVDTGPPQDRNVRTPTGRRTLMLIPGAVIRSEAKWAASELATMANGSFVDVIEEIDDAWVEVAYADREVSVHGFVSRRAPPGRLYRTRDPDMPPPAAAANAKIASGTCLYARRGGDPIGYVVGDRDAQLDPQTAGWWTLSLDSPWGALAFSAKGATAQTLEICAPPNSVPPSTLTP